MRKDTKYVFILIIVAMGWGAGYFTSDIALDHGWSTMGFLLFRSLISCFCCFILGFKTKFWKKKINWIYGIISGLLFFGAYALQLWGQSLTTVANTSVLVSTGIILVPVLGALILKHKNKPIIWMGALIGFMGALIVAVGDLSAVNIGDLLILIASLFYSLHTLLFGEVANKTDIFGLICIQFLVMSIMFTIAVPATGSNFIGGSEGWIPVVYCGVVAGALCSCGQFYCQKHIHAAKASLIMATEGLFGTIFAILFSGDKLTWQLVVGGIVLFSAVVVINLKSSEGGVKNG